MKFTKTTERLPAYGKPVLIVANGVLQHNTYMLDGADDVPDWFEPYHSGDHKLSLCLDLVEAWMYVSDLDELVEDEK